MSHIRIKSDQPFVEARVDASNKKDFITIGCKAYNEKELLEVRKLFRTLTDDSLVRKWAKELEEVKQNSALSDVDMLDMIDDIQKRIDNFTLDQAQNLTDFYKSHVLYIKSVSLVVEDDTGQEKILSIPDTRETLPNESPWKTSEECLAALLDIYLDSRSFGDSLMTVITSLIFNLNLEDKKRKN